MDPSTMKRPSAWLPVVMSAAALAIVLVHLFIAGTARETDEGTAAHLFQILMAGQVPVIVFFALKWLPVDGAKAVRMLALQVVAAVAAFAPVAYFHL